ncbi:FAD-dependent oxidoreductase [Actinokineospora sp. NBRC 105648]|uniref:NAD(P)/FAD-dependent oxidoreductase n=1 Tax=Actinokineospora sp. NBRC 105648 TaxID=3032206 RepID=UPI0024A0B1E0|nr:FAD-dependent oxidoreductase [Actinokineospora sp. NBRC 105648]GLZ42311.1 hypothetical protein Acsp05_59350 [Actinokineospora sp. NBRC 105648]
MTVIVVGAGISGIACARVLAEAGVAVRVLERGHVVGGRMATKRYAGRRADIGAGYFTASDPAFTALVDTWTGAGLARPWTDTMRVFGPDGESSTTGPMRYAAPAGLRSLVEHLAEGLDVVTGHTVERVGPGPTVDGEQVDAVVLAMPDPQAQRLLATDDRVRPWSPALVATIAYPDRSWADFHGAFVNDHPVLTTVFDDGSRRGDGAPVLVAHTTAEFARRHLADPGAAGVEIASAVSALFDLADAVSVDVHRWTYASPLQPYDRAFALDDGIGLVGDAWGSPRVETAWLSGTALGRALV